MITIKAPAKINLTFEVLRQRPDGYHEIRSVFQTIALYDKLSFNNARDVSFSCDMPEWSAGKSLAGKAVKLLQESVDCKKGVEIKIKKLIPLSYGLGGDSSDAAAVLRALDKLWKLNLPQDKLLLLAAQLGSDVPFFLRGGTSLAEGRGEIVTPLPSPPKMWVVLVVPDISVEPGKTTKMYAALKPSHFTDGSITTRLADALKKGHQFESSLFFNTFENVAFDFFQGLNVYKEHLLKLGAHRVHLAGSGPTLFSIFKEKSKAGELIQRCRAQGMKIYLAATI